MNDNVFDMLNIKGKDLQLGDAKYSKKYIAKKLKDGYIILTGDIETINMIETAIYTPGTDRNLDFSVIMGRIDPGNKIITNVFLAKKNNLLKERIMSWCNISEEIYNKLILINIVPAGDKKEDGVIWDYSIMGREVGEDINAKLDDFAGFIVRDILEMVESEKDESEKDESKKEVIK